MRSLAAHRKPNPACKGNQKVKKRRLKKRLILCKGKALACLCEAQDCHPKGDHAFKIFDFNKQVLLAC